MKKLVLMALAAGLTMSGAVAQAADKLTLQLKWVTQAQFAGYYVAQDQGFYDAEGLDVTIKPGGPDVAPAQVIALPPQLFGALMRSLEYGLQQPEGAW